MSVLKVGEAVEERRTPAVVCTQPPLSMATLRRQNEPLSRTAGVPNDVAIAPP